MNLSDNQKEPGTPPKGQTTALVPLTKSEKSSADKGFVSSFVWGVKPSEYIGTVLKLVPDDFSGKLLEVPACYFEQTTAKYKKLSGADITFYNDSEQNIQQAKQQAVKSQLELAGFDIGDPGRLCYPDSSFDIVLSINGMHTFPDNVSSLLEIIRVLKKGGRFCGTMYMKGQSSLTDFVVSFVHVNKGSISPPFYTRKELEKLMGKHFSKVTIQGEKAIVCFECIK